MSAVPALPAPAGSTLPARMRAVLQPAWGGPEVLTTGEVDVPALIEDTVLVRVAAAGLHKGDWHLLTGTPYPIRLVGYGFARPRSAIPGNALAGTVVAVGAAVHDLHPGDEVFGEVHIGAFAGYALARPAELAPRPGALTLEESASLPVSSTTALQGLRDAGKLQHGQSVLINGAAGGVGSFAVQIARAMGADVTGVCSTRNVDLVAGLGAHHVVDHTREDFTRGDRRYDVIFDLVGNRPLAECRRVLAERGRFVASAGGADNRWTGPMGAVLVGLASNLVSKQTYVSLMAKPSRDDLLAVRAMVDAGQVKPALERRFRLEEVADALRVLGSGHSRGKSILVM